MPAIKTTIHYPGNINKTFYHFQNYDNIFKLGYVWFSNVLSCYVETIEVSEDKSEIWVEPDV